MVLRRDRCVYRETTADSSTKPRYVRRLVDYLTIVIEQRKLADFWSGYKSDRVGGGEEGGGGWKLGSGQAPNTGSRTGKVSSFMPNVNPECKLLTTFYVGRFYKVKRV